MNVSRRIKEKNEILGEKREEKKEKTMINVVFGFFCIKFFGFLC